MGFQAGLKAFTAAVVGGIGNLPGAVLGGLVIGLAESFATGYLSSTFQDAIVFVILIAVMIVRPSGLLGRRGGAEGLDGATTTARPSGPEPRQPRIGVDEWVASHEERREQRHRRLGRVRERGSSACRAPALFARLRRRRGARCRCSRATTT